MTRTAGMKRGLWLGGAMLTWCSVLALAGAETVLRPPPLEDGAAPAIDGVLDEAAWQDALALDLSVALLKDASLPPSDGRTRLRLFVRGGVLHIAAECLLPPGRNDWPPAPRNPNTGRHDGFRSDPPPFENDHVELSFAPNGGRAVVPLLQVAVDLAGDRRLRRDGEPFDAEWRSAVRLEDGRWIAEIALPPAAIGGEGGGYYWLFNATRTLYGVNGQLVQGLALTASGYGLPRTWLLPEPVKAGFLEGQVAAYLAAMERMRPYFTGRDRKTLGSLRAMQEAMASAPSRPVPVEEALSILRTLARTDEQVMHDVLLNYLFDGPVREERP